MNATRVVIPRTRSVIAAVGATMAAAGVFAFTVELLGDPSLLLSAKLVTVGVGFAFTAAMLILGFKLVSARGGLIIDPEGARVGLGVTGERDTWWLPLSEVQGFAVLPLSDGGEMVERWAIVLRLAERAEVVIAESDNRSTIILFARQLAEQAGLPVDDQPEPSGEAELDARGASPPPLRERSVKVAVYRRAALQGALTFFGVSLVSVGVVMFAKVAEAPVFGFIFAPLLGFLGLAFLATTIAKRLAVEELSYDGERFWHHYQLGRLRWGRRGVKTSAPRWRLYIHGMRGAHLELIGDDGALVIAGGATTRSKASVQQIARLPGRFAPISPAGDA